MKIRFNSQQALFLSGFLILGLIIFFYPKYAGEGCGFCPVMGIHKIEYDCMGFKYAYQEKGCLDCGGNIFCFGVVGERKCFGKLYPNSSEDVEIPCGDRPAAGW